MFLTRIHQADDSVFMHALSRQGAPVVIGTSKIFAASRVHDSFERLLAACHYERGEHDKLLEKEASWMSTYDETRWPELVQAGVSLASEAVDGLRAGSNVVIEGIVATIWITDDAKGDILLLILIVKRPF